MADSKYIAQVFTDCGIRNIPCTTITEGRRIAEDWGTTASTCAILKTNVRGGAYDTVARHVRDTNGDGTRWFKAVV